MLIIRAVRQAAINNSSWKKIFNKRLLSLALAILFTGCFAEPPARAFAGQPEIGPADYAVYTALISKLYLSPRIKLVVISDETTDHQQLKALFNFKVKYELLQNKSDSEDKPGKGSDPWKVFYEKYPDSTGLIRLSAVKFNPKKDRALVYIERSCGLHCASGEDVELIKKGGRWRVHKRQLVWVS